ncbi:hypothetical protein G6514_002655 [Epicoccum nigrum]|nr:hypothetical protein G6514_002655 [Epicoccum nigrum]
MKTVFSGLPTWLDVVRFDKEVSFNATPEEVVFVDVGGGFRWQCQALKKAYPSLPGKFVLQGRHDVIAKAQVAEEASPYTELDIETTVYDFFTPLPLKNA